jgi:hypothetical protein
MLAEKYLPVYHFKIFHEIAIPDQPVDLHKIIHTKVDHWLVMLLFRLRGLRMANQEIDPASMGFSLLEDEGQEIAYGIVSSSPYFGSCVEKFSPADFAGKYSEGYLRGMILFGTKGEGSEKKLFTETRVHCGNKKIYNKFRIYWFFVKPFSSLIRAIMLKQFRKKF